MPLAWPEGFGASTGAILSSCRAYRYALWRKWDHDTPPLVFIMLNPSTADESTNDRTINKCKKFALREEAGGIVVVNIFAFRNPHPHMLYLEKDPVGPENDFWIKEVCNHAIKVVAAWGCEPIARDKAAHIVTLLTDLRVPIYCLGKNKGGSPKHPLYRASDTPLIAFP